MITQRTEEGITAQVLIEAPRERVFPYLVEPERLVRWMGTTLHGAVAPGEGYRLDFFGDGRVVAAGEFISIEPPDRVVFTWGWENEFDGEVPPGSSTVAIELVDVPEGTNLTLTHTGLPDPAIGPHSEGWEEHLGRLAAAGSGHDPGPYGGGAG